MEVGQYRILTAPEALLGPSQPQLPTSAHSRRATPWYLVYPCPPSIFFLTQGLIAQAGLKFPDPPASTSKVLGLHTHAGMPSYSSFLKHVRLSAPVPRAD